MMRCKGFSMVVCVKCGFDESDTDGWIVAHRQKGKPVALCSLQCGLRYSNKGQYSLVPYGDISHRNYRKARKIAGHRGIP